MVPEASACGLARRRLLGGTSPPRCPRWAGSQASPLSPVSMRSQEACQPGGPVLAPRPGSHWTENNFCHVGFLGSQAPGARHTTAPQMFPGASRILQDLLMPRPSYPDSQQPHSSVAVLDAKARGANSQDTDTAAKAPAQARIWSSSSGAGCPVPPHRRQASAQAVSRTSSHLSLGWEPTSFWGGSAQGGPWRWPPAALEGCRGTFQKPQDPSDAGQRFTFHARRPVLGLHPPWPPVPCRGAGPGGLRPRCRRLSEAVLQALERGASLGASCENPTLAVLAGQTSVL